MTCLLHPSGDGYSLSSKKVEGHDGTDGLYFGTFQCRIDNICTILANQNNRKLGVSDRKLEGNNSTFVLLF